MKSFADTGGKYLKKLAERKEESHVYKEFQLVGLEVADILSDRAHKSLYIKLARDLGKDKLLIVAKSVAERKDVKNKGAYFMKVLHSPQK